MLAFPVWRVLAAFVVAQWVIVLGLALTVRHAGWIYYQGGDQLWYYTTGWLLGHGQFPVPGVGYLWPVLLAPFAAVSGPNIANAYPAIIAMQFLFLLPVALLAVYGIGVRIGGRLFGYWTALLWLIVPLIGIKFTDAGYHERFTEALLPQAFGLTAMGDFPSMVAALLCGYFCIRVLAEEPYAAWNAVLAGLAAGAAIAVKPGTAPFLVGPVLAFAVARQWRFGAVFAAGLAPAVITLAFVKWRGFGYLPLFHSAAGIRVAAGVAGSALMVGGLHNYTPFDWHTFVTQLDQLREHFWSARLIEWLVIGGAIAVFIRSRRYGTLIVGWFGAIVILKTGSGRADLEGGSLLRILMPAYPAFVVMLASLPFLFPGVVRRIPVPSAPPARLSDRARMTAVVAALLLTAVVPFAAFAAASPQPAAAPRAAILQQPPIPVNRSLGLRATKGAGGSVKLSWNAQHATGGPLFYHVFRTIPGNPAFFGCAPTDPGAQTCRLALTDLGATRQTNLVDRPGKGRWEYFVGVAANWVNDTTQGDVYLLGTPVAVRTP